MGALADRVTDLYTIAGYLLSESYALQWGYSEATLPMKTWLHALRLWSHAVMLLATALHTHMHTHMHAGGA